MKLVILLASLAVLAIAHPTPQHNHDAVNTEEGNSRGFVLHTGQLASGNNNAARADFTIVQNGGDVFRDANVGYGGRGVVQTTNHQFNAGNAVRTGGAGSVGVPSGNRDVFDSSPNRNRQESTFSVPTGDTSLDGGNSASFSSRTRLQSMVTSHNSGHVHGGRPISFANSGKSGSNGGNFNAINGNFGVSNEGTGFGASGDYNEQSNFNNKNGNANNRFFDAVNGYSNAGDGNLPSSDGNTDYTSGVTYNIPLLRGPGGDARFDANLSGDSQDEKEDTSGNLVVKHVYVFKGDTPPFPVKPARVFVHPQRKTHQRVIYIHAPVELPPAAPVIPAFKQDKHEDLIYLLVKRPEEAPEVVIPAEATTQPSRPQVRVIKFEGENYDPVGGVGIGEEVASGVGSGQFVGGGFGAVRVETVVRGGGNGARAGGNGAEGSEAGTASLGSVGSIDTGSGEGGRFESDISTGSGVGGGFVSDISTGSGVGGGFVSGGSIVTGSGEGGRFGSGISTGSGVGGGFLSGGSIATGNGGGGGFGSVISAGNEGGGGFVSGGGIATGNGGGGGFVATGGVAEESGLQAGSSGEDLIYGPPGYVLTPVDGSSLGSGKLRVILTKPAGEMHSSNQDLSKLIINK